MKIISKICLVLMVLFIISSLWTSCTERDFKAIQKPANTLLETKKALKVKERIIINGKQLKIQWNQKTVFKSELVDSDFYNIPMFHMLYAENKGRMPVGCKSKYMKSKNKVQSPDIIMIEKYVNFRMKYFKTSLSDVKNILLKTQIFTIPYCNSFNYTYKGKYIEIENESKNLNELLLEARINLNKNIIILPTEYRSIREELVKDEYTKRDLDNSIDLFVNEDSNYFSLLDSLSKTNINDNEMVVVSNNTKPPHIIFKFTINKFENEIHLEKRILNPEVVYNRDVCL